MNRCNYLSANSGPLDPADPLDNESTQFNRHIIALIKGEGDTQERYFFKFDNANRSEVLRVLGRFASNPDLSFSWFDAATISERIRNC